MQPEINVVCKLLDITNEEYLAIIDSGFSINADVNLLEKLGRFNDGSDITVSITLGKSTSMLTHCSQDLTIEVINMIKMLRDNNV